MADTPQIGELLRTFREQKGLGIKSVGKQLDVSYSYISKVENGHRTPNRELVQRLCALYEVNSDELLAKIAELPTDIQEIIQTHGTDVFAVLRELYLPKDSPKKRK